LSRQWSSSSRAAAVNSCFCRYSSWQCQVTSTQWVFLYCDILRFIFTCESSYCFQRVLAIAILPVCLFICHTGGSVKNGAS